MGRWFAGAYTARAALLVALTVAWLNFLLTAKWAHLPGALNGWKRPWYGSALLVATLLALTTRRIGQPVRPGGLPWLVAGGWALLGVAFLWTFPPSTWHLVPLPDDWPPRFQSTVDGLWLLRRGAVVGWQWAFLGGYQTAADLTQSLTMIGAIPMALLGERGGFHAVHALLVAGIPLMVYLDVAADGRRDVARLTAFFALVCSVGFFGTIMPSGDTNSIAGVFAATMVLAGSRLARLGWRSGGVVLVLALTLALYSHGGFFLYALIYLAVEAWFYGDWRMAFRAIAAATAAVLAALPQYIEMLRYPDFFIANNIVYAAGPIDWSSVARKIFYNVEILLHPHRWFNDYLALTVVFLAVFVWVAVHGGRSRARFYACAALVTVALLRFDVPEVGYLLIREMHMLAALAAPPLAWFVVEQAGRRSLAWALIAVIGLFVQSQYAPIRHVDSVTEFDPALISRLSTLDGHLVLLENSPHRDLDAHPGRRTERTPFGIHFEALLPGETGQLYYGQPWDGWHWTPFRGQVIAGGSFRGRAIAETPHDELHAEMRKWGVRHLVVWSDAARRYLDAAASLVVRRWVSEPWVHYELKDADPRAVVLESGSASLQNLDPLGGEIHLRGASRNTRVVVRMNYYGAWTAVAGDQRVPLFPYDGQLAFHAPADGDYVVQLVYPTRPVVMVLAVIALIGGGAVLTARSWQPRPAA